MVLGVLKISGKGGAHEIGAVVFTVSALVGVPVEEPCALPKLKASATRETVMPHAQSDAIFRLPRLVPPLRASRPLQEDEV